MRWCCVERARRIAKPKESPAPAPAPVTVTVTGAAVGKGEGRVGTASREGRRKSRVPRKVRAERTER